MMALPVNRKTMDEAQTVAGRLLAQITAASPLDGEALGDLAAPAGVRDYPGRVKCATLPCHALRAAIERS
jgi:nitrogen fixation NifU-like protein